MSEPSPESSRACPSCGFADAEAGPINFCPSCGQDLRSGGAAAPRPDPLLGQVIAERYRLLSRLGEGGMGAVYKAEHVRMGKALALKILRGDFAQDPSAVARFSSEAQIVSRLSHPHTIAVFDFGETKELGGFYLAMEYVPGRDLAQALRDGGRFTEARAAQLGHQILGSLAEAHAAGVVHRDVKPGNVMLMQTRPGEDFVKVLDFGIAKLRDDAHAATTTSAGAIIGTPSYLAPEQARADEVDGRADLYAVGCLLYELVAGRPPFVARNPMAVVSAHLHEAPPPLAQLAPGTSPRFAEVVHRALEKQAAARWASADEMAEALLAAAEPTATGPLRRAAAPTITGELEIARREDFEEFERQVQRLRRSRVAAPVTAGLLLLLAGLVAWRWQDAYALLAARAPALAARVPAGLRPSGVFDGTEHEPNDVAGQANPLPIPPGPDGRPAGGVAVVRGHVGEKLSDTVGDADVHRLELPSLEGRKVLVAEWRGPREGEGIRGLDVTLSLNRERPPGEAGGRTSAPLVASVDRGGPGKPERLVALVEPGAYYLAVREKHDEATGPVEKPTDGYVLTVRLEAPAEGEEVEPDDAPEAAGVGGRAVRYPEWRRLAERNALGEGQVAAGTTALDDPDAWAVAPRGPAEGPTLVAVVPDAGLALEARRWMPDATDLAPPPNADRVRFEPAGEAGAGEVLLVELPAVPAEDAPALLQLQAAAGAGGYRIVPLGAGSGSGAAVLGLMRALAEQGRLATALELAAGFTRSVPRSPARSEVLVLAGGLAAQAVPAPGGVAAFDRAAGLLGAAVYELEDGEVRYRAGFEARVQGRDRLAEQAAVTVVRLGTPCSPEAIAARAEAFVERWPASAALPRIRLWRARALEEALWAEGGRSAARREQARAAWKRLEAGAAAREAQEALARLAAKAAPRQLPPPVCPDPDRR